MNRDESVRMMRVGLDALRRVFPDRDDGDSDGSMGGEPSQGYHSRL